MNILMLYENDVREYESLSLIKAELIKRGHNVVVTPVFVGRTWFYYAFFSYDILTAVSIYGDKGIPCFVGNSNKKYKIVNMQWEQVSFKKSVLSDHIDIAHESGVNGYHICWGKERYNALLRSGINENRLAITGFVTLDLCKERFRDYYTKKEEFSARSGIPMDKKWLLFISSFVYTFMSDNKHVEYDKIITGHWEKTQERILNWFDNFLGENEDYVVIYRPHPAERVASVVLALEEKHTNFRVIFSETVREWIVNCDTVCTALSTSITEAHALNKKCVVLRPFGYPDEYDNPLYENCNEINTYEGFVRAINDDSFNSLSVADISRYYDNFSNDKLSYMRIADFIEDVYSREMDFDFEEYFESIDAESKYIQYKQMNTATFISDLMRSGYFIEAEVMIRLLRVGYFVTGLTFNPIYLRNLETDVLYREKVEKMLSLTDKAFTPEKQQHDLNSLKMDLYYDIMDELRLMEQEETLDKYFDCLKRLLNLRATLILDEDIRDYASPYTARLVKATEYLMTNREYPEYSLFQNDLNKHITDFVNNKEIIIYGFGLNGSMLLKALQKKRPDFSVKAVFDIKFMSADVIDGVTAVSPSASYVKDDVAVFITLGDEKLFFEVKKEMESLGYTVKDGIALLACINMLGTCG